KSMQRHVQLLFDRFRQLSHRLLFRFAIGQPQQASPKSGSPEGGILTIVASIQAYMREARSDFPAYGPDLVQGFRICMVQPIRSMVHWMITPFLLEMMPRLRFHCNP